MLLKKTRLLQIQLQLSDLYLQLNFTMATSALRITALKFKARNLYKEVHSFLLPLSTKFKTNPNFPSLFDIFSLEQLHYLGKNYPDPTYPFHKKLHSCFLAHVGGDEEKLEAGIRKAEFIKKG